MSRPKVLVTREVFQEQLDLLAAHFDVSANQGDRSYSPEQLATLLADKDGALTALTDRIDGALLARCPRLKAVCNMAVGYNNIDVAACTKHHIMATNTPGVLEGATADFTWALILAVQRRLSEAEAWLRAGEWKGWRLKQFLGRDTHHCTLGILGMGRIGRAVAHRAVGFDMTVLYHNNHRLDPAVEHAHHANYVGFDDLLSGADILTIHVPYSPATHHLIGATELARMKPSAILINTARGGVVDDAALARALKQGKLAGAGLDVFENEPSLNAEFLALKNVVLTPHIASSSEHARFGMAMKAAENLVAALVNGKPPNWLNPWTER
jgi:gluconate 2-dehydrogenase